MKKYLKTFCLFAALIMPLNAFAVAGQLTSPSLALPSEFPMAVRTNILAALSLPDCKFAGGEFVNSTTRMWYEGDTKALNLLLRQLAKCDGVVLAISFVQGIGVDPDASWLIQHSGLSGSANRISIQINLDSKKVQLQDLEIPDIK